MPEYLYLEQGQCVAERQHDSNVHPPSTIASMLVKVPRLVAILLVGCPPKQLDVFQLAAFILGEVDGFFLIRSVFLK